MKERIIEGTHHNGLALENKKDFFVLRQWVDGECEDKIFLTKDDIEKMFNLTK